MNSAPAKRSAPDVGSRQTGIGIGIVFGQRDGYGLRLTGRESRERLETAAPSVPVPGVPCAVPVPVPANDPDPGFSRPMTPVTQRPAGGPIEMDYWGNDAGL